MLRHKKHFSVCVFFLAIFFAAQISMAADIHVDDDNTAGAQDGTTVHPYTSIQIAIDVAENGDTIKVAAGTYGENIRVSGKTLNILGGYAANGNFNDRDTAANATHIQGDGTDAVVTLINPGTSVLDGFRITGGTGSGQYLPEFYAGGGIFCDGGSPTVSNNTIENNDTRHPGENAGLESQGGGIYSTGSDISIIENIIRNNAAGFGAGIKISDGQVVIRSNTVQGNTGTNDHGGGMHIYARPAEISYNHVIGNVTGKDIGYGYGGGILVYGAGCSANLSYNVVHDNFAPLFGGGEFIDDGATATIDHDLIYNNTVDGNGAVGGGAGLFVDGGNDEDGQQVGSEVTVRHCTIADNTCTSSELSGCGLQVYETSQVTVLNSIFWGNGGDDFDVELDPAPAQLTVTYSVSQEAISGQGNISSDPLFAGANDYHLKSSAGRWDPSASGGGGWVVDSGHSPGIDAGDTSSEYANEPAPNGGRVNMGVYGNTATAGKSSDGNTDTPGENKGVWESRGIGAGGALFSATISPHNPQVIYMATDMSSVFRTDNFGRTWETVHFNELWGGIDSHVRFTSDPLILYAVSLANDLRTPKKSIDGGDTWSPLANDPTSGEAYSLHADPGYSDRILVSDYSTLYFSNDGGVSFSTVHSDSESLRIAGAFWDGNDIFVGTNAGLLVSSDGGTSFTLSSVGGIGADEAMVSFAGAKEGSVTRFFAVTLGSGDVWPGVTGAEMREYKGIYRLDRGQTAWTGITAGIADDAHPFFVAMALNDIDVAYVAGGNVNTAFPVVYKTTDGGDAWNEVFLTQDNQNIATGWCGRGGDLDWWFPEYALGFAVSPDDPNRVIITDLGFAHVTDNGGTSWRQVYVDPGYENPAGAQTPKGGTYSGVGIEQTSVWWLHWTGQDTLLAAFTDIRGIRSTDNGETWTSGFSHGLPHNTTYHIIEHPTTGTLYGATSSVHDMYEVPYLQDTRIDGGEGHVIMSNDQGQTWPLLKDFRHPVIWLAIDPNNTDTMYASVIHSAEGGIYVTRNLSAGDSASWTKLSDPPRTEGHPFNIHVLNDGTLLVTYSGRRDASGLFTESSGVFVSSDGGTSWEDLSDPLMVRWTKDIVIDPHDSGQNTWYAAVYSHWGTAPIDVGGLFRTTDRGKKWTRISDLFRVESCTIHPDNPDILYLSTEAQGLWSTDNLRSDTPTFTQIEEYPFKQPVRIFFNPSDHDEVWATSYGGGLRVCNVSGAGGVDYNLSDVILVLQVLAGMSIEKELVKDINSDGKTGMDEVIYLLQIISGLRLE
ncbi:DUF1565 domain-containing protein [Desulfococcaceae bacterium HSG8]|nr:DUF1565 domain-containing protein [Desulfococcaceae bacterium HSG8]